MPFEIDDHKGPIIDNPISTIDQVNLCLTNAGSSSTYSTLERYIYMSRSGLQVKQLHELDLEQLQFVGESLTLLRQETLGQVGYQAIRTVTVRDVLLCPT